MAEHKQMSHITGIITAMSEPLTVVKSNGTKMVKSMITIETADGQKGFFEARINTIERIKKLEIGVGDEVLIGYVFIGSEKNGKLFNNLFVNFINYNA